MGAPAKFLFDQDFSTPVRNREASSVPLAEMAARIAEAEARGYQNGFAAAQIEAQATDQRRMALALDNMAQMFGHAAGSLTQIENKLESEAVEVALAVSRKLCGELIAREPLAEIMNLVRECFREIVHAPHLVVRIHDALYEQAKGMIEDQARKSGFEGRLIILAEPDLAIGDCKIEWADGGMTRERDVVESRVAELVHRYIDAKLSASQTDAPLSA